MLENGVERKKKTISILGMGYVGLPMAIEFAKTEEFEVIGFDVNKEKIEAYKNGIDVTKELGDEAVKNADVIFTTDTNLLMESKFHIVAVPTPTHKDDTPDLRPLEAASRLLAQHLRKGSIVVYESTVYPGITEEVCIPILEQGSGFKCGQDFEIGYSPERVNPGDKVNTFSSIVKLVAATSDDALEEIAATYDKVIKAGTYRCSSIRVAEAAKLIENYQRDLNIVGTQIRLHHHGCRGAHVTGGCHPRACE